MPGVVANAVVETPDAELQSSCGSERDGTGLLGLSQLPANLGSLAVFIDTSNAEHSAQRLGCPCPDYGRLVRGAAREFARRLGMELAEAGLQKAAEEEAGGDIKPLLYCRKAVAVVGKPENVHPADKKRIQGWKRWIAGLTRCYGFQVLSVPIDFHGFHVRAEDRAKSPLEAERQWLPAEKGVDVLLATRVLQCAMTPDRPDAILVISGDGDFAPVLQQLQNLKPPVHVAVASFSGSLSRVFYRHNPVGYKWGSDPILLDHYLAPAARNKTNAPASSRSSSGGKGAPTLEDKTMSLGNGNGDGAKKADQGPAATKSRTADLDVGRIKMTRPKRGELSVYRKRDGLMGAKVECADGTDYGVSPTVRARFPEIGGYAGWAFADDQRKIVFRFLTGDVPAEPERLCVIDTSAGRVYVPALRLGGTSFENGALVAFTWKYVRRNGKEKAGREATEVHPLDAKHLSLISQLIAGGKILFPAHAEVLGVFLEGLAAGGVSHRDTDHVNTALGRLAAAPGVPTHLQQLARVERTRLLSAEPEAANVSMAQRQRAATVDGEPDRAADEHSDGVVATDVTQMKLLLS